MIIGTIASGISGNLTVPNFSSIATASGSGVNTVTFSNIPQTYNHLQIRWQARFSTNTSNNGLLYFSTNNSNSGNNYSVSFGTTNNNAQFGSEVTAQGTLQVRGAMSLSDNNASVFAAGVVDIFNYSNANAIPTFHGFASNRVTIGATPYQQIATNTGAVATTGAITSITIINGYANNFDASTTFALYGVR